MALQEFVVFGDTKTHKSGKYTRSWRPYVKYTVDESDTYVTINVTEWGMNSQHTGSMSFSKKYVNGTLSYGSEQVETYTNTSSYTMKGIDKYYSYAGTSDRSRTILKSSSNQTFSISFALNVVKGSWKDTSSVNVSIDVPSRVDPVISCAVVKTDDKALKISVGVSNAPKPSTVTITKQITLPSEVIRAHPSATTSFVTDTREYIGGSQTYSSIGHIKEGTTLYEFNDMFEYIVKVSVTLRFNGGTFTRNITNVLPRKIESDTSVATIVVRTEDRPPTARSENTAEATLTAWNFTKGTWDVLPENNSKITIDRNTSDAVIGYTLTCNLEPQYLQDPLADETKARIKITYDKIDAGENQNHRAFFNTTRNSSFTNGLANVMFAGGSEYPSYGSKVWYSSFNDPLYFPDDNFIEVGSNDTKVMGITKIGEYLGIIKQGKTTDTSIYIAYPTTYEDNSTYAVKPSANGIGACSKYAFNILGSETLFLSKEGVMAISFNENDTDKQVKNRSYYVDGKLTKEPISKLINSYSFVWNSFYLLAVESEEDNGHVYILDGNQRNSWGNDRTNLVYECYFWDNVPAKCFVKYNNDLWFSDGKRLCRFKDETDSKPYNDNGEPIRCEWSTILDDDGSVHYYKTLQKKGTVASVTPVGETSVELYIKKDDEEPVLIKSSDTNSDSIPSEVFTNKKVKKYKRLQFILRNEVLDQPFGVDQIIKSYKLGNYSKK